MGPTRGSGKRVAVHARLDELADETVFLVGGALNESDVFGRIDCIFRLHMRPDVLDARLAARGDGGHTNTLAYRHMMHSLLARAPVEAARGGWVLIDTSDERVEETADRILQHLGLETSRDRRAR